MNQKLPLLAQRLRYELDNLERVIRDAESGWQKFIDSSDSLYLSAVALNLHSFYTGVEELLRKIALDLRETIPQGEKWHHALLQQMATAVSGLRPAVISQNSHDTLDEYRKFRHLVRNIYPFRLDPDKIQHIYLKTGNFRKIPLLRRLTRRKKATSRVASDYFAAFRLSLKRGKVCLGQVKGGFSHLTHKGPLNPFVPFLKARRQRYELALTRRCHDPPNVGLILDLHLASSRGR